MKRYTISIVQLVMIPFVLRAQELYEPPHRSTSFVPPQRSVSRENYYLVKKWDTLWDLSGRFLENPFRWKEIHRLNPSIGNPHWIYPGNKLIIPGVHSTSSYSSVEKPDFYALTRGFLDNTAAEDSDTSAKATLQDTSQQQKNDSLLDYSDLRATLLSDNFFSPQFMERIGFLWFQKDAKGMLYPGNGVITECDDQNVYRQFDDMTAELYDGASYSRGDLVNIYHSDRFVKFKGKTANLVRVVAKAKVVLVKDSRIRLQLYKLWDIVECDDHIGPAPPPEPLEFDDLVDAPSAVEAEVFERIEETESPYLFRCFLIDQGSEKGITTGDLFAIYPVKEDNVSDRPSAIACVVNTRETSSSLVVVKLFSTRIEPGDKAIRVKRIKFKE
ncbi:MAG: LysM peptidoglycan-binding domain-containing protein [Chitinivibrionales bacterium]|nr:LysM peptidoglycan-binding domain-containing protein [Chitinivibrionales bacterium]